MLYVGWMGRMGQMGLGWMVIIGHRSSKSTFGANNIKLAWQLARYEAMGTGVIGSI